MSLVLSTMVHSGCVHSETKADAYPAAVGVPARETTSVKKSPPAWTTEDCQRQGSSWLFVGYGEGPDASAAGRNALLSSRQNALTCLFGGTIAAKISIREDSQSADYRATTDLTLNYAHVNWSGYETIPGRTFYTDSNRRAVYIQYRWEAAQVEKERQRLDALSRQIADTEALKKEVSLKQGLVEEQKAQLVELQAQETQLASIRSDADRAVARLGQIKAARNEKSRDIMKVLESLYCGITIREFIQVFREPDKVEVTAFGGYRLIDDVEFTWDHFVVKVRYSFIKSKMVDWPKAGEKDQRVIEVAKDDALKVVELDRGVSGKKFYICR